MLPVMRAVNAFGMRGDAEGSEGSDNEGRNDSGRFEDPGTLERAVLPLEDAATGSVLFPSAGSRT